MIPKIIHYCWISGEENMPEDIKKCVESWHKHLPDYQFINWNDSNFDWNICSFTKHCREKNLYAFCSDYVRFWALYNYGGIYLDCDVMVYKSFDELLSLNRILSKEIAFNHSNYEAAILGGLKGDIIFYSIMCQYNSMKMEFTTDNYIISPHILSKEIKEHPEVLKDVLDFFKYFDSDSEDCIAQHQFKNSWTYVSPKNCLENDDIKIFLYTNTPILNYPTNKKYNVISSKHVLDNENVIDISDDKFTKTHILRYGKWCGIHYLYNHLDILLNNTYFATYNACFIDLINSEKGIVRELDKYKLIIPYLNCDYKICNKDKLYKYFLKNDVDEFILSFNELYPDYKILFENLMEDRFHYDCTSFVMKTENFIEMCVMCFSVLNHFDKKMGYTDDLTYKNIQQEKLNKFNIKNKTIYTMLNMEETFLEYLAEAYCLKHFNISKSRKTKVGRYR